MADVLVPKMNPPHFCIITPATPELEDDQLEPPQGALALAAALRATGYQVAIEDLAFADRGKELERLSQAECFAFSTYTLTYPTTQRLVHQLRSRYPDSLYLAGGPHASALPKFVAEDFDAVIVGEADEAIVEIAHELATGKQPPRGTILRPPPPQNLDALPLTDPDRFVDLEAYHRRVDANPAVSLVSSRGCGHSCAFCNSRVSPRGELRLRSAESVEREIWLHLVRGRRFFRFNDDAFTADEPRLSELARRLGPLGIRFRCFARGDDLARSGVVESLVRAGCVHVSIGVESLSDRILKLMRKEEDSETILSGLERAFKAGLRVRIYLIVGYPGETEDTVEESLSRLQGAPFHEFSAYNFCPFPGSDVFQSPHRYGIREIRHDWEQYLQIGRGRRSAGKVMVMESPEHQRIVERTDALRRAMIDRLLAAGYVWSSDAPRER